MGKRQDKVSEKTQADRFKEAAKEAEADESEEAFEERLKRIAKSSTHSRKKEDK